MQYKLNASIIIRKNKVVVYGKKTFNINMQLDDNIKDLLYRIESGMSQNEIESAVKNFPNFKLLYDKFVTNNMIVTSNNIHIDTPTERSYELFSYYMSEIDNPFEFENKYHISILGCGGLGGNVALSLASSGFSNFTLVDFDKVEINNLNRQIPYGKNDIGKYKTIILREKILEINARARVKVFEKKILTDKCLENIIDETDMIVSGIDTPPILSSLSTLKFAYKNNIPIIFGSVGYDFLKVGPLLKSEVAKKNYIDMLESQRDIITKPVKGSLFSTNAILASIISNNVITYFYPFKETILMDKELIIDAFNYQLKSERRYGSNE